MAYCGVKFRAYPTPDQAKIFAQWIGCVRVIYNFKVEESKESYKKYKEQNIKSQNSRAISHFKKKEGYSFLKDVPYPVLFHGADKYNDSYKRYQKKLASIPKKKKKSDKDSICLYKALKLYYFKDSKKIDGSIEKKLYIGTKTKSLGELKFKADKYFQEPNEIYIKRRRNKWYISFCYENGEKEHTEEEILKQYSSFSESELNEISEGYDVGCVKPLANSSNEVFDLTDSSKMKLIKLEKRKKREQKNLARKKDLSSKNRKKNKDRINKIQEKIYNIRNDFNHKWSRQIVDSPKKIFIFEDLKIKNLVKRPKAKKCIITGKYLRNGAKQKAGLTKKILSVGLSKTLEYIKYKAAKKQKIFFKIDPKYTSQECANCGHIQKENRKSQLKFLCLSCSHADNADFNAAKVIKKRGLIKLLSDGVKPKVKTRLRASRSKVSGGERKTGENSQKEFLNAVTEEGENFILSKGKIRSLTHVDDSSYTCHDVNLEGVLELKTHTIQKSYKKRKKL